jgi:hypothetical protein
VRRIPRGRRAGGGRRLSTIVPLDGGAAWEIDGEIAAAATFERDGDRLMIRTLSDRQEGAGEALVRALAETANVAELVAPDGDKTYRLCGFRERNGEWTLPLDAAPAPSRAFTLTELEGAIRGAWSADTADEPETWSEDNPARNHCDVTSVVVRDFLGGEILIANVVKDGRRLERHAWNRLPSGLEIDLTREQFRKGEQLSAAHPGEPMSVRRSPERYRLFASRVLVALGM